MSTPKVEDEKKLMVHKLPQIILSNKKLTVIKRDNNILQNFQKVRPLYKEDLIYESKSGDFLNSAENICIVNRHILTLNIRRTIVRRAGRPSEVLKSSDAVVKVIGQENYDLIFSALCSVLSLELKVRGILALLTAEKLSETCAKKCVDRESQTEEKCMDIFFKQIKRKRVKRNQLTAYVVKDPPATNVKKIVIKPEEFHEFRDADSAGGNTLPTLTLHDEDSNISIGNMSSLSINTLPHLLENPEALLNNIQKYTEPYVEQTDNVTYCQTTLTMLDGTQVTIPVKPEDDLHIATSDILNSVAPELQCKLKLLQAFYDWKYCLERDEDNNLPIHIAVNANDMELLRRQCLVLRLRQETVDIVAGNMSPLQMSLYQKNAAATALLLQFGADPLKVDAENRTCFHLAAEETSDHLTTIINHCRREPLSILRENEELCTPGIELMTKEEQASHLLDRICQITDNQGYTPLMVASKLGLPENVSTLIAAAPRTVNSQMSNSGNTALYLAVSAACIDASNRGNMKKVSDNYMKIVEKLIESGADPSLENHMGNNVTSLLTEYNIGDLSQLIANKVVSVNFFGGKMNPKKSFESYMVLKDCDGSMLVKELKSVKSKPIILENVRVDAKIDNEKLIVSKIDSGEVIGGKVSAVGKLGNVSDSKVTNKSSGSNVTNKGGGSKASNVGSVSKASNVGSVSKASNVGSVSKVTNEGSGSKVSNSVTNKVGIKMSDIVSVSKVTNKGARRVAKVVKNSNDNVSETVVGNKGSNNCVSTFADFINHDQDDDYSTVQVIKVRKDVKRLRCPASEGATPPDAKKLKRQPNSGDAPPKILKMEDALIKLKKEMANSKKD